MSEVVYIPKGNNIMGSVSVKSGRPTKCFIPLPFDMNAIGDELHVVIRLPDNILNIGSVGNFKGLLELGASKELTLDTAIAMTAIFSALSLSPLVYESQKKIVVALKAYKNAIAFRLIPHDDCVEVEVLKDFKVEEVDCSSHEGPSSLGDLLNRGEELIGLLKAYAEGKIELSDDLLDLIVEKIAVQYVITQRLIDLALSGGLEEMEGKVCITPFMLQKIKDLISVQNTLMFVGCKEVLEIALEACKNKKELLNWIESKRKNA